MENLQNPASIFFSLFRSFGRGHGFENRTQKRLSGEFTRGPRGWPDGEYIALECSTFTSMWVR
jgi:hypothetical protein